MLPPFQGLAPDNQCVASPKHIFQLLGMGYLPLVSLGICVLPLCVMIYLLMSQSEHHPYITRF